MTTPSPLSSFSSSLRRLRGRNLLLAMWALVALVAAVALLLLLRDPKGGPRADVSAYIAQVNAAAASSAKDYKTVQRAYRTFALAPTKAAQQERRLQAAADGLTQLRERMERIQAPPPAAKLRLRLIAFFRQQEAVARELLGVSTYVPRLSAAERALAPASTRMRKALGSGGAAAAQAGALTAYAAALDRAARAVGAIDPPALFRASHRAQLARLARASRLMRRLGGALLANDRATLEATIRELGRAGAPGSAAARTAILAYNHRVERIRELAADVERERSRLNEQLS